MTKTLRLSRPRWLSDVEGNWPAPPQRRDMAVTSWNVVRERKQRSCPCGLVGITGCRKLRLAFRVELRYSLPMSTIKRCSKCRRRPRRSPDQAYCDLCHARASKVHRDKRRAELEALRAIAKRFGATADL